MAKRNLKVENDKVIKVTAERDILWDMTMHNIQAIGGKRFGYAPKELMFSDERIQRDKNMNKVNWLVKNWNANLMTPLKVSIHPESKRLSIIDGDHRFLAGCILGLTGWEVEFLQGLPEDPEERLKAEAKLFASQSDGIALLTPAQKHKANVIIGVEENVAIEELVKKYNIELKPNLSAKGNLCTTGVLTGFQEALRIAKASGKDMFDNVLYIICESRWNLAVNGLGNDVLRTTNNILRLHPEYRKEITELLISKYTKITPQQLFAEAHTKYPLRKNAERLLMYVEDWVCEELGITRTYNGGNLLSVLSKVKVA